MFDFKKLDEKITIEKYNPNWPKWFKEEKVRLENIFKNNLAAIEHYGSTAVQDLFAKPIIDILVGLTNLPISNKDINELKNLNYEYFGQLHESEQRYFARKRNDKNFNLAIVPFATNEWNIHLIVRDYLRVSPNEVEAYSKIKQIALTQGKETLIEYHLYKDEFVKNLVKKAKVWKANS